MSTDTSTTPGTPAVRSRARRPFARLSGFAAAALLALSASAAAQDPGPEIHPQDQAQQKLVELFNKVETRLREIDKLLSDAGAGDTRALKEVGPAGIDELLKQSKKSGEEAVQDIDKILEIARQMQQQSKSSGQGQPGQQQGDGKDPLEGQGQTTQQREQTPSAPEKQDKPGDKKPDGQNGKEKPDKKKPDGESNPNDPKASKQSPKNQPSGPPPGTQTDKPGQGSDARDRWGDLPQRARDVFRSEGGHDMPVQYRDWIDAYYRRLNQKQP